MKNSQVFNNFPYNWWLMLLFYFIVDLLICLIYKSNFVICACHRTSTIQRVWFHMWLWGIIGPCRAQCGWVGRTVVEGNAKPKVQRRAEALRWIFPKVCLPFSRCRAEHSMSAFLLLQRCGLRSHEPYTGHGPQCPLTKSTVASAGVIANTLTHSWHPPGDLYQAVTCPESGPNLGLLLE